MRKISHSIIALLVFASSSFAIAPMAFCNMQTQEEEQTPSCCEKPETKADHCQKKHANCPICSFELCKVDPTPAKPATVSTFTAPLDFVTIPVVTLPFAYTAVIFSEAVYHIDTGPPIYLLDCTFRI